MTTSSILRWARACALPAALLVPVARAGETHLASGPQRVALIELFTSEGCSSCPPADRWLGALRSDPGLWRAFVPVAFHVNYWDDLGWKDRLASPAFTARQYAHAADWGSRSVYTPCFVRDGAEWRPGSGAPPASSEVAGTLAAGAALGRCRIRWMPAAPTPAGSFEAHVAVLGGGLVSRVSAGENRGATLLHEFVALGLADGPLAPSGDGALIADIALPAPSVPSAPRQALAVWVTRRGALAPLQAAGGWMDGPGN